MKKKIETLAKKILRPLEECLAGKVRAGATPLPPKPVIVPTYGIPVIRDWD